MRPTREQWEQWSQTYTKLPFLDRFKAPELRLPISWLRMQQQAGDRYVILESGKVGRYTYVIIQPDEWLQVKNNHVLCSTRSGTTASSTSPPLEALRAWFHGDTVPPRPEEAPPFTGGITGWISYDVARSLEHLPTTATDDLQLPDLLFYRANQVWVWDHQENELICAIHLDNSQKYCENMNNSTCVSDTYEVAMRTIDEMVASWRRWCNPDEHEQHEAQLRVQSVQRWQGQPEWDIHVDGWSHLQRSLNADQFRAAVLRIQEWIRSGDVFQVNLSVRQSCTMDVTPAEVYEWLRVWNPSPYMGLFHAPDHQLVSGSPELLVKTRGRQVYTRPIAGTRPRGQTPELDEQYEQQLRNNEKELAEHVMLVDLERNDLGRVCSYGTVKVSELLTIERYSHVMHLVSQVEGHLHESCDAIDLISATFPGGTITGAPKIRTMEIIETLEPVCRGPYTGSMGWFDYGGDVELNILIRTLVHQQGIAHIQAGAGIVIDSIPDKEYQESLNKAKALWKALMSASREREESLK